MWLRRRSQIKSTVYFFKLDFVLFSSPYHDLPHAITKNYSYYINYFYFVQYYPNTGKLSVYFNTLIQFNLFIFKYYTIYLVKKGYWFTFDKFFFTMSPI